MGHIKDYILGCLLLMAGLWILSGGLAEKGEQHASSVDPAAVKPDRQALLRKVTDNLKDADSLTTIRKGFTQRINDQTAPGIKPHVPSEADLVEESGNYQGIQLDQESKGESIISDLEGESGERLTPEDRIRLQVERDKIIAELDQREKEYQVKAFIERARENGFDVVLDEDLNIIRVRKIAKPKPYQFR